MKLSLKEISSSETFNMHWCKWSQWESQSVFCLKISKRWIKKILIEWRKRYIWELKCKWNKKVNSVLQLEYSLLQRMVFIVKDQRQWQRPTFLTAHVVWKGPHDSSLSLSLQLSLCLQCIFSSISNTFLAWTVIILEIQDKWNHVSENTSSCFVLKAQFPYTCPSPPLMPLSSSFLSLLPSLCF